MFLQILPADNISTVQSVFENQLGFVILGLAVSVFAILKLSKALSKIKMNGSIKRPSFTS